MSEFEDRTRATLDASASRVDGRVRSRLTQARHAALDELVARRSAGGWARWRDWLRPRSLAPAGAMAAAAIVAVVLWTGRGPVGGALLTGAGSPIDDLELLADNDALAVSADGDYEFYEWAAAQDDANGAKARGT